MPKITIFILVLVFTTSFEEVSYSWESDMHYGLTKWLAVKAGFKLDDAEIIAAGAESSDRSSALKASVIVPINICCGKSAEASRHVQHHHFPSDGYVPSPRYSRKVIPGHEYKKNSGNRWVRQEIAVPVITGINGSHNTNLNRFGQSLHPLGDSWSHQGVPDMPPCPNLCPENLVWSHSEERGGWASHDADLTNKYENDSVETAKTIYYYMEHYLIKNPNYGQPGMNPWESLEPQVRKFAKMQTALEKRDWFDSHNDVPLSSYNTYPCFLRNTSLIGNNDICKEKFSQKASPASKDNISISEASSYFEFFLTDWIIRRRIDKGGINELIKEHVNIADIKNMLIGNKTESLKIREEDWVRTLFAMWLVRDHGLVNHYGHGIPDRKGFEELPQLYDKMSQNFENLSDAIHFPCISQPFLVTQISPFDNVEQRFAAFFQFYHAPRDMVTLIASRGSGSWKITGLCWIID